MNVNIEIMVAHHHHRLPPWFKIKIDHGDNFFEVKRVNSRLGLNTVCKSARCPNIWECWNRKRATFMILGNICTRTCRFCAVKKGQPTNVDMREPEKIADAVKTLGLRHVVITSVTLALSQLLRIE
jgi:lipoic acid synthetase